MLKAMVTRWRQAADDAKLEDAAADLGYTPQELMTVASLVQAEGRGDEYRRDRPGHQNRVENPENGVTNGAAAGGRSVNDASAASASLATEAEIESVADPPKNTYKSRACRRTDRAPGDQAIAAARAGRRRLALLCQVDLKTAKTKFTADYDESGPLLAGSQG